MVNDARRRSRPTEGLNGMGRGGRSRRQVRWRGKVQPTSSCRSTGALKLPFPLKRRRSLEARAASPPHRHGPTWTDVEEVRWASRARRWAEKAVSSKGCLLGNVCAISKQAQRMQGQAAVGTTSRDAETRRINSQRMLGLDGDDNDSDGKRYFGLLNIFLSRCKIFSPSACVSVKRGPACERV